MNHAERLGVANEVAKALMRRSENNLIYLGVHGSTFKAVDGENSDIDMIAVLRDKKGIPGTDNWLNFIHKDVVVGIGFHTLPDLDHIASTPNYLWPYRVNRLINNLPIHAEVDIIDRYSKMIKRLDKSLFTNAAGLEYLEAYTGLGKIRRNSELGDLARVRSSSLTAYSMRLDAFVALLNRGLLEGSYGYKNLDNIQEFGKIPKNYIELTRTFWLSSEVKEIVSTAEQLWTNCTDFAKVNGVPIRQTNKSMSEVL